MSEDVLKKANIKKKKSARHIHFAEVADTGELVSIESVKSGWLAAALRRLQKADESAQRQVTPASFCPCIEL